MATLANTAPTLGDIASMIGPDGKTLSVVQLLEQTNDILNYMSWMEGNLPTGHRHLVQTSLPTVGTRALNAFTNPSKGDQVQIDEGCAIITGYHEIEEDLYKLNGGDAYRVQQARNFTTAMNQTMANLLIYGNATTNPTEFNGLATRYSSLTGDTGENIIDAGGTGSDNTSIYLVVFGNSTVSGIFPKGSQAGLQHSNLGLQVLQGGNEIGSGRMTAYVDRWQWKCGLCVLDWQYVCRIANIDVSNLVAGTGAADLVELMIRSMHRIPSLEMGRPVFLASRTARQELDIQALQNVRGGQLSFENVDGRRVTKLQGIPVVTVDRILETEAAIS